MISEWGKIAIVLVVFALVMVAILVPILVIKDTSGWGYKPPKPTILDWRKVRSLHEFHEFDIEGTDRKFKKLEGSQVLVVFATSTKYLWKDRKCNSEIPGDATGSLRYPRVLFFPCNGFNNVEPGPSKNDIKSVLYECHFRIFIFEKVEVKGEKAYDLWQWLNQNGPKIVDSDTIDRVQFLLDENGHFKKRENISKAAA